MQIGRAQVQVAMRMVVFMVMIVVGLMAVAVVMVMAILEQPGTSQIDQQAKSCHPMACWY